MSLILKLKLRSNDNEKEENKDLFTDENDGFVPAAVLKKAKELSKKAKSYAEDSFDSKIIKAAKLIEEEKSIKKDIKTLTEKLHVATKKAIETLTDEQAKEMLRLKWIAPLCDGIAVLPDSIVSALEGAINALTKKYSVTMLDVESEIEQSEKEFADLIDELEGDEFDMLGLKELQKMLRGEENDRKE